MKFYNYPLIAPFDGKLDLKLTSLKAQQVTCDRGGDTKKSYAYTLIYVCQSKIKVLINLKSISV
jgi:hypothetical protein